MASRAEYTLMLMLLDLSLSYGQQQLQLQQQQNTVQARCFRGLFVSSERLRAFRAAQRPSFRKLYNLSNYTKEVTYSESCGVTVDRRRKTVSLADCAASQNQSLLQKRSTTTCQPCCRTEMSFSVPQTVTDVYSGTQYQAKHFPSSYQLIHLGHCVSAGAECGLGGTCMQATRIEWVLVELPSGRKFVSTSVPSHCTCIYT